MNFGIRPLDSSAEGAILVHSLRGSERVFRKGRVLQANDIAQLNQAGHKEATLARLEGDDIHPGGDERQREGADARADV